MPVKLAYFDTGSDASEYVQGVNWNAQTFPVTAAHRIYSVRLPLYRAGTPNNVTISIRATDGGGAPTGADLCAEIFSGNGLLTTAPTAGEWTEIVFTNPAFLNIGTFGIVARSQGIDTSNTLKWRCDTTAPPYTGGQDFISGNSGSSWAGTGYDLLFEEWGSFEEFITMAGSMITSGFAKING